MSSKYDLMKYIVKELGYDDFIAYGIPNLNDKWDGFPFSNQEYVKEIMKVYKIKMCEVKDNTFKVIYNNKTILFDLYENEHEEYLMFVKENQLFYLKELLIYCQIEKETFYYEGEEI